MGKSGGGKSAARAQERANAEAQQEIRRQFNITRSNLQPFLSSGTDQISTVEDRSSIGGLDDVLGQIFDSENFQNLRDERSRAVASRDAASGNFRSGQGRENASNVSTELGFALEQLLTGRSTALADKGQNAAAQLGAFGQNASGSIAGLSQSTGQAASQGILADKQADSQNTQSTIATVATIAAMFFSDPSLKENIEVIGDINGLNIYQWDWKEETKDTLIENCSNIGFMADEVEDLYPQHVHEFAGFMTIDYPQLLDTLDKESASRLVEIEAMPDDEGAENA